MSIIESEAIQIVSSTQEQRCRDETDEHRAKSKAGPEQEN